MTGSVFREIVADPACDPALDIVEHGRLRLGEFHQQVVAGVWVEIQYNIFLLEFPLEKPLEFWLKNPYILSLKI